MRVNKLPNILWFVIIVIMLVSCKTFKETTFLLVGSYTDKKPGKGISIYEFNNKTGEAALKFQIDSIINSSYLRLSPNGKFSIQTIPTPLLVFLK